ncbi:uncharacterized protein [Palaemon carinicauda]|uniref:uncharacterized protein n=1 Tax=Palaemon carinicauda TaxID=392227 RepID=UPI0035B5A9E9
MKQIIDGYWWKVACVWICVLVREAVTVPLLGPHIMSFDSVSPFIEWQGPAQVVVPTAGNPLTAAGEVGPGPGPQTNIIRAPCSQGRMDVSGCRIPFQFPQKVFRDSPQLYMRGQTRGGPFPGNRLGRARFPPPRPEPETPEPEQIRGD